MAPPSKEENRRFNSALTTHKTPPISGFSSAGNATKELIFERGVQLRSALRSCGHAGENGGAIASGSLTTKGARFQRG
jgi:hypothetical protein